MDQTILDRSSHLRSNNPQSSQTAAWQRWGPIAGAGALALFAISKRSKAGVTLALSGGLLAHHLASSASQPKRFHAEASFALNCPPEQAYRLWRNFETLPLFMRHLDSVKVSSDRRSHWTARGPFGRQIEWE